MEPDDITASLEGPHEVASGTRLNTYLRLHNHTDAEVAIHTQGVWTPTRLVDIDTGDIVGGYWGYVQRLMMKHGEDFQLPPHGSLLIPLKVGTASTVPELGYAVPAGKCGLVVYLYLGNPGTSVPRRCRSRSPER
jgi:hypothetical protein